MKLSHIIAEQGESIEEFNERSNWITRNYSHYVFVYGSDKKVGFPEIWTHEKAMVNILRLRALTGEREPTVPFYKEVELKPCLCEDLFKIEHEEIDNPEVLITEWRCCECDKVRHVIEQEPEGLCEMEEETMGDINWEEMGTFIKLPKGVPTVLELRNWRQQEKFKEKLPDGTEKVRFGLTFDVWKENNFTYDETTKKEWTVTAIKACAQLKPILEKAKATGATSILVSIVVAGEGNKTVYTITEQGANVPPAV